MALDFHVSFPDGSMAMAYDPVRAAMKSVRGIRDRTDRRGTRALPAYGAIEMRPIIHASALNDSAARSYSANSVPLPLHFALTIRPSIHGPMCQTTYGPLFPVISLDR